MTFALSACLWPAGNVQCLASLLHKASTWGANQVAGAWFGAPFLVVADAGHPTAAGRSCSLNPTPYSKPYPSCWASAHRLWSLLALRVQQPPAAAAEALQVVRRGRHALQRLRDGSAQRAQHAVAAAGISLPATQGARTSGGCIAWLVFYAFKSRMTVHWHTRNFFAKCSYIHFLELQSFRHFASLPSIDTAAESKSCWPQSARKTVQLT